MDAGCHRRLVLGQHFVVRQILCYMADVKRNARRDQKGQRRADAEKIANETNHTRSSPWFGNFLNEAAFRASFRTGPKPQSKTHVATMWTKYGNA